MVTLALAATGVVVTGNVAVVAPAAMVALAGTCAAAVLLLLRVTTAPPAGAADVSSNEPCDEAPPATAAGASVTDWSDATTGGGAGTVTVSVAVLAIPFSAAVIRALLVAVTTDV